MTILGDYLIIPNKGAGALTSLNVIVTGLKLRFWAFQRWFRIENRTIIKGVMETFVIFGTLCFGQTMGGALIRVVPLLGIIRYDFMLFYPKWAVTPSPLSKKIRLR